MRQIFVILAIVTPLFLSALFVVNGIASDNFPMLRDIPFDESQSLQQTYLAGLDHCENNYEDFDTLGMENEYEKCVNSVETWHAENIEK